MNLDEIIRMKANPVAFGTLIGREFRKGDVAKPLIKYGNAALAKKGEDYFLVKLDCERVLGDPSSSFAVFAVLV